MLMKQCAVPENIYTPPTEKIGISWGVIKVFSKTKIMKELFQAELEFQEGGRSWKNTLLWGRYGYFLELHNTWGVISSPLE